MLAIERRKMIMELLRKEQRAVVADLSKVYDVTEETIRRDLEKLEKEGLVKKTYGGAVLNDNVIVDLPYNVRRRSNVEEKQQIAALAAQHIEDGDHIMLDASSTALFVAKAIKHKKRLTVITNSVEIVIELADRKDWKVLSTGGTLREGSLSLGGYQAERMLSSYHVDKAIISCKGIDLLSGLTDSSELEAQLKKLMLEHANISILVLDSSKFDRISFTQVCDLSKIDLLVTEKELNTDWIQALSAAGVEYSCSQ